MTIAALPGPLFVGRAGDLAAIGGAVQRADSGQPGVVYIEGAAGAGKTALVRRALSLLPGDATVARAEADEFGRDVAFGVVSQWTRVRSETAFAAGMELLQWIGDVDRQGITALVLEDLHWADPLSREATLTAFRRLSHERAIALVTARPDPELATDGWPRLRDESESVEWLSIDALTPADVAAWTDLAGMALSGHEVERLHRHTGGHPLYISTLLAELTPETLRRPELPIPRSLAGTILGRIGAMSSSARDLAAALAVLADETSLAVLVDVSGVTDADVALEQLRAATLISTSGDNSAPTVEFAHQIFRTVVYDDLSPSRRQSLHRAAAEHGSPHARLRHRVAAADQFDESLAVELEQAAAEPGLSGARAGQYLRWSSDLSEDPMARDRRLLLAARRLLDTGEVRGASALRSRLEACALSPDRSLVLGQVALHAGEERAAEQQLREAASSGHPSVIASALSSLGSLYTIQYRAAEAVESTEGALATGDLDGPAERATRANRAFAVALLRGARSGLDTLDKHLPADPRTVSPEDVRMMTTRGMLQHFDGQPSLARADLEAAIRLVREGANHPRAHRAHLWLSNTLYVLGEWDDAQRHAEMSVELVTGQGLLREVAQTYSAAAMVPGGRGEWERAEHYLASARAAYTRTPNPEAELWCLIAEGALHRARGDAPAVARVFGALAETVRSGAGGNVAAMTWWHSLIDALIDVGELHGAARQLEAYQHASDRRSLDITWRVSAIRGRLAAADQDAETAASLFEAAIATMPVESPILDRAVVHHAFGQLLLAAGRRPAAVEQLERSVSLLDGVGAAPFAGRVEPDLAAAGAVARRGRSAAPTDLTPRERDVAILVARGNTNREVAAQLYVSQKAVEYHLGNIFAKLGLSNRRQIAGRLGLDGTGSSATA